MAAAVRHRGQQMAPFPQVAPELRGGAIYWRFFVVLEAKENELWELELPAFLISREEMLTSYLVGVKRVGK